MAAYDWESPAPCSNGVALIVCDFLIYEKRGRAPIELEEKDLPSLTRHINRWLVKGEKPASVRKLRPLVGFKLLHSGGETF